MKAQNFLVIAAALISNMALASDPDIQTAIDQATGREIVILSEEEGRSFFRPKTTDDIRELASESAPEILKAQDAIASHQDSHPEN